MVKIPDRFVRGFEIRHDGEYRELGSQYGRLYVTLFTREYLFEGWIERDWGTADMDLYRMHPKTSIARLLYGP